MSAYTYTQEDLKRARKFDRTVHQGRADIIHCACVTDEALAILIAQVRAEAQEAFSAECGRFHNDGPKCATCGRSDRDTRLAAAEELAQLADILIEDAERAVNPQARLCCYRELKDARDKLRGL